MYLEHFGLSDPPFRGTPQTELSGASRGAVLSALIYAVTHDDGIVKVTGEVGTGKTVICRMAIDRLPDDFVTVYLANPSTSRDDLLFSMADELGLSIPEKTRTSALRRHIQEHLNDLHTKGRRVAILLDEAHAMSPEALDEICLLSNFESGREKLLHVVLFGQPELNGLVARSGMRPLKERITHNFVVEVMGVDDVFQYLDFRLHAAGYRGPSLFPLPSVRLIAEASLGLIRRINLLADKALVIADREKALQVSPKHVRAAIQDSQFGSVKHGPIPQRKVVTGLIGLALGIGLAWKWMVSLSSPPVLPPVVLSVPVAETPSIPQEQTLLQQRLEETTQWLNKTSDDRWFIQLLRTTADQSDKVESFMLEIIPKIETSTAHRVGVYAVEIQGQSRMGVIYGDFQNETETLAAIQRLPEDVLAMQPYPRQVRRIR
ncbi:MAG: AAA family ATPase [Rhodocyclaceae bacterium]|nr:AAA family ATPase [Rhodocyclaceae bacterium]